ncbi:hypothetical protein HGRIS_004241 [Hohenbuehelia grisea]|uniref:Uncharacterized protein n=1 Tax=Hohenbuehelia grisea TaxID=104357 RepID=A0ABR3IP73_9AGAR
MTPASNNKTTTLSDVFSAFSKSISSWFGSNKKKIVISEPWIRSWHRIPPVPKSLNGDSRQQADEDETSTVTRYPSSYWINAPLLSTAINIHLVFLPNLDIPQPSRLMALTHLTLLPRYPMSPDELQLLELDLFWALSGYDGKSQRTKIYLPCLRRLFIVESKDSIRNIHRFLPYLNALWHMTLQICNNFYHQDRGNLEWGCAAWRRRMWPAYARQHGLEGWLEVPLDLSVE